MNDTHAAALMRLYTDLGARPAAGEVLATAKLGIFDVLGCIVAGVRTPTATKVRDLVREQGAGSGAAILGTREVAAPALAALANGVAGHVLDYDDMSSTMLGHPSVVLVPAMLALGAGRGASGAEVIRAYVLGFEVNSHMSRTLVPHHYNQGWHSTSSVGIFGATAACARLLGLDAAGALNALAIAASNSAGVRGNFGSMTKSLHAGQAAEGAVRAAQLSERGFSANAQVFDAPGGYFDTYGKNRDPQALPEGGALEIEYSGIGIKPYACCGAGVAVIDAALDLHGLHGLAGASIDAVSVVLSPMAASIMPFHEANDGPQAKYSLAYCAAVALLDGRGGLAQFEDVRVMQADVRALVKKTTVRADARMASGAGRFGVEMTVRLAGGREVFTSLEVPRGHPRRKLEEEKQRAKFMECAGPVVGERRAAKAVEVIDGFENLARLGELIELLCPERA